MPDMAFSDNSLQGFKKETNNYHMEGPKTSLVVNSCISIQT